MKATAKTLRITPKKLNLIADLIRDKNAVEAMDILSFAPKKGAKLLNKIVASAVANAKTNFKQDEDSLYIKEILVSKAPTFKRWLPASRGRTQPILKRNAHVTVTVAVREKESLKGKQAPKSEKSPKKNELPSEKKTVKKTGTKKAATPKAPRPEEKSTKTPKKETDKA